MKGGALFCP